jgi:hypothetical protein
MEPHPDMYAQSAARQFTLTENALEATIEKRWFNARHVMLFLLAILWNSILAFFYTAILAGQLPVFIYLFTVLHATAGIWMLYTAICGFFNKTVIQADRHSITVRHSPLPWPGQKKLNKRDVCQFYVCQQINSTKGTTYITYDVDVITKNNKVHPLIQGLDTAAEARFIEQKLESYTGIKTYLMREAYVS